MSVGSSSYTASRLDTEDHTEMYSRDDISSCAQISNWALMRTTRSRAKRPLANNLPPYDETASQPVIQSVNEDMQGTNSKGCIFFLKNRGMHCFWWGRRHSTTTGVIGIIDQHFLSSFLTSSVEFSGDAGSEPSPAAC